MSQQAIDAKQLWYLNLQFADLIGYWFSNPVQILLFHLLVLPQLLLT